MKAMDQQLETSQNLGSKILDLDIKKFVGEKRSPHSLKRKTDKPVVKMIRDRPMTLDELEKDVDSDKENYNHLNKSITKQVLDESFEGQVELSVIKNIEQAGSPFMVHSPCNHRNMF